MANSAIKEVLETILAILVLFIFGITMPAAALFIFGGAETQSLIDKTVFYYGLAGFSMLAIIALNAGEYLVSKGTLSFKKWGWLKGLVYDPEVSPLNKTFLGHYIQRPGFMLKYGLLIFSLAGIVAVVTNTFFAGIPSAEFQVSKTGELILAVEPAVSSETLFFGVILSLFVGLAYWHTKRNNYGKPFLMFLYFLTALLMGFMWMGYHSFRYGSDEVNLVSTFLFGFLGSGITILTGSLLWWWIWHFFNNLYLKANSLFSDEMTVLVSIIILIIYILILFLLRLRKHSEVVVKQ